MSIVEELRSKASRDNRDLLDRAAAEIEDLERNLAGAYKKVESQREEIRRLHNHMRSLEQSRDNWKGKAERVGNQLNEVLKNEREQSEGEWIDQYNGKYANPIYVCSLCGKGTLLTPYINELNNMEMTQALSPFCPNCGAKMKGE